MRKPGYKTTEFWFTLVSFIFSGLFLFGVIDEPDTRDNLTDIFTHVTESVILLGGQAIVLARYIRKRKEEKIEYEKTKQKEAELIGEELEKYIGIDKTHKQININTATIGELIQLPHIGPSLAQKIIDYRNNKQGFRDTIELIEVSGIGYTTYQDIKQYIIVR